MLKRSLRRLVQFYPAVALMHVQELPVSSRSGAPTVALTLACTAPAANTSIKLSRIWVQAPSRHWSCQGDSQQWLYQNDSITLLLEAGSLVHDESISASTEDHRMSLPQPYENRPTHHFVISPSRPFEGAVLFIEGELRYHQTPLTTYSGTSNYLTATSDYQCCWPLPAWPEMVSGGSTANAGQVNDASRQEDAVQARVGLSASLRPAVLHSQQDKAFVSPMGTEPTEGQTNGPDSALPIARLESRPRTPHRSASAFIAPRSHDVSQNPKMALNRPGFPSRTASASYSVVSKTITNISTSAPSSSSPENFNFTTSPAKRQHPEHTPASGPSLSAPRNPCDVVISARLLSDSHHGNNAISLQANQGEKADVKGAFAGFSLSVPSSHLPNPRMSSTIQSEGSLPCSVADSVKVFDVFFLEIWFQNIGTSPLEATIHLHSPRGRTGQSVSAVLEPASLIG